MENTNIEMSEKMRRRESDHTSKDFNRICNMLSEYGSQENSSGATLAYLEEHCDIILAADAVQQLAQI